LRKVNKSSVRSFGRFFLQFSYCLMFLNIQIDLIVLKTFDQLFTLTTKKSLHIIFKVWLYFLSHRQQCQGIEERQGLVTVTLNSWLHKLRERVGWWSVLLTVKHELWCCWRCRRHRLQRTRSLLRWTSTTSSQRVGTISLAAPHKTR